MQKEILLYEIPVYAISEVDFNKKWGERRKEIKENFIKHGHTEESANQGFRSAFFPQYVWKYNQIVGYINISVTRQDINVSLFCTSDKTIRVISSKKHLIQKWEKNGLHFYALHKDNEYLRERTKSFLKDVKEMFPEKYFVDDLAFENTIGSLDIQGIMKNSNQ
ncbi:MAG: hypothetical protein PHP50_12355 [Lachnospiraceae bacterium]|nr:hypothetical protein [Lachnospiraceae bacterium]